MAVFDFYSAQVEAGAKTGAATATGVGAGAGVATMAAAATGADAARLSSANAGTPVKATSKAHEIEMVLCIFDS